MDVRRVHEHLDPDASRPDAPEPFRQTSLVYDVDSDVTVANDGTRMWAYDLGADTWTVKGVSRRSSIEPHVLRPGLGPRRRVGDDGDDSTLGLPLWSYEVETDTWTPIPQAEPPAIGPHYEFFAYDASVDRLVAYANAWPAEDAPAPSRPGRGSSTSAPAPGRGQVPSRRRTSPPGLGGAVPHRLRRGGAADRAAGPGPCGRLRRDRRPLGDPVRGVDRQTMSRVAGPECRQMPFMVYDPVNERLVVYGGTSAGTGSSRRRAGVRHADPRVDRPPRGEPGASPRPDGPTAPRRAPRPPRRGMDAHRASGALCVTRPGGLALPRPAHVL